MNFIYLTINYAVHTICRGGSRGGGGAPGARPPPPKIGKNMIFWRKIVISHEIPQTFSRLPQFVTIFLSAPPPNLKSWIRP